MPQTVRNMPGRQTGQAPGGLVFLGMMERQSDGTPVDVFDLEQQIATMREELSEMRKLIERPNWFVRVWRRMFRPGEVRS